MDLKPVSRKECEKIVRNVDGQSTCTSATNGEDTTHDVRRFVGTSQWPGLWSY